MQNLGKIWTKSKSCKPKNIQSPTAMQGEVLKLLLNPLAHDKRCKIDFAPKGFIVYTLISFYCSLTDKGTFETARNILRSINEIKIHNSSNIPIILVGNKCDLVRKRQVSTDGKTYTFIVIFDENLLEFMLQQYTFFQC